MSAAKKARTETTTAAIEYSEPHVMAEIGCNHMGELEIAKELLTLAKECGCAYGKFQKRCPKELLTSEQYSAPHPNPRNSYGDTYGAHREFLELTVDQHRELKEHCDKIGLGYSCSVWDTTSAKEIVSLKPDLIKVGSPSNTHWEMQKVLRDEYDGDVHISTGMTTKEEIEKIVQFWEEGKGDAKNRVVLYNCTSGYPVPFKVPLPPPPRHLPTEPPSSNLLPAERPLPASRLRPPLCASAALGVAAYPAVARAARRPLWPLRSTCLISRGGNCRVHASTRPHARPPARARACTTDARADAHAHPSPGDFGPVVLVA